MAKKPIKVSQATIDRIKKMGMTAALKKAGTSKNAEYVEGIRRMYGERRLAAAQKNAGSKTAKSADAARAKYKPAVAKSADAARAMASKPTAKSASKTAGKGLFPGLLTGNYKGKKITRGKDSGPGYFKS
jgi:FKBP-type peptidyl-prolyl cis-trans isomerase